MLTAMHVIPSKLVFSNRTASGNFTQADEKTRIAVHNETYSQENRAGKIN
jgi:hypothetical protein